jgi:hypothetical protein
MDDAARSRHFGLMFMLFILCLLTAALLWLTVARYNEERTHWQWQRTKQDQVDKKISSIHDMEQNFSPSYDPNGNVIPPAGLPAAPGLP